MDFKPLEISDISTVRPFFDKLTSNTCDFSAGGMFMWRDFFRMEFAVEEGTFFSRLHDGGGQVYYNLPVSDQIETGISKLIRMERGAGEPVRFCTIPEDYLPQFEKTCRVVQVTEQPDFSDYIYAAEDLISLKGKKYSGTRNQISQFKRNADSWEFRRIGKEDVERVIRFFDETYLPSAAAGAYEREENAKVLEVLNHLDAYGMMGGMLLADQVIVGFSLSEVVRDTLYIHIEKADRQVKGAYQMLMNQSAAAFAVESISYINREEDMGDPGLRAAKKAYHPIGLLKKYMIEVR